MGKFRDTLNTIGQWAQDNEELATQGLGMLYDQVPMDRGK